MKKIKKYQIVKFLFIKLCDIMSVKPYNTKGYDSRYLKFRPD